MPSIREWMQRFIGTVRPRRRDEELAEERRLHAELECGRGRRVTGTAQALDALRDQRGLPWLDDLGRDTRHAARMLRGSPGFAAVVIVTVPAVKAAFVEPMRALRAE